MPTLLRTPVNDEEWHEFARRLVRAHMTLRGWRFAELSRALAAIGIEHGEVALRNRIGHARFSAALFLQCMRALEVEELMLPVAAPEDRTDIIAPIKPRRRKNGGTEP